MVSLNYALMNIKNNFKKVMYFNRVNKKINRYLFLNLSESAENLFKKKLSNKDLLKRIDQNQKVHLKTIV